MSPESRKDPLKRMDKLFENDNASIVGFIICGILAAIFSMVVQVSDTNNRSGIVDAGIHEREVAVSSGSTHVSRS